MCEAFPTSISACCLKRFRSEGTIVNCWRSVGCRASRKGQENVHRVFLSLTCLGPSRIYRHQGACGRPMLVFLECSTPPLPLGPPYRPRHRPTVGSLESVCARYLWGSVFEISCIRDPARGHPRFCLRVLVHLVIHESGKVSLEHLLLL